jgi:hypothetical protein
LIPPVPRRLLGVAIALLVSGAVPAGGASVSSDGSEVGLRLQQAPRVARASLSSDTIALGDRFELRLGVIVGENQVAFLPDSVEGTGFEPLGAVEWSTSTLAGGEIELSVVYPLIAFDVGSVVVPDFEVFTGRRDESEAAGLSVPGAVVGSWSGFREAPAALASARVASVPERSVWVASVLVVDETTGQLVPRPAADVWGANRHWVSTLLMLVFALGLLGAVAAAVREWRGGDAGRAVPDVDPRVRALIALDELLASGLHGQGRTKDFFTESSTIVRAYVEEFDASWSRAWTSTELMRGLSTRVPGSEAPEGIVNAMARAEAVKFGGARPDLTEVEAHWRVLRDWIEASSGIADSSGIPASGGIPTSSGPDRR